jgi:hypothetical protein
VSGQWTSDWTVDCDPPGRPCRQGRMACCGPRRAASPPELATRACQEAPAEIASCTQRSAPHAVPRILNAGYGWHSHLHKRLGEAARFGARRREDRELLRQRRRREFEARARQRARQMLLGLADVAHLCAPLPWPFGGTDSFPMRSCRDGRMISTGQCGTARQWNLRRNPHLLVCGAEAVLPLGDLRWRWPCRVALSVRLYLLDVLLLGRLLRLVAVACAVCTWCAHRRVLQVLYGALDRLGAHRFRIGRAVRA